MPNRNHRPQLADQVAAEDTQPLVVHPATGLDDRKTNPKDLEVDTAAISHGIEHGGTQERRAETLSTRGSGGRKRSGNLGRHQAGADHSRKR